MAVARRMRDGIDMAQGTFGESLSLSYDEPANQKVGRF